MQRVYVLGAGASHFAGFPLGRDLLPFLKTEWENTRDCMVRKLGRYALDFVDTVRPALPGARVVHGEPDLEFVLSLTDEDSPLGSEYDSLINDLHSVTKAMDLTAWDLAKVRLGFTTLVEAAFLHKSHQLLTVSSGPPEEEFVAISAAWVERIHPGDILITFKRGPAPRGFPGAEKKMVPRGRLWNADYAEEVMCIAYLANDHSEAARFMQLGP